MTNELPEINNLRIRLLALIRLSPPNSVRALAKEMGISPIICSMIIRGKQTKTTINTLFKIEKYIVSKEKELMELEQAKKFI